MSTQRPSPVLAAHAWPDNAALIADCAELGYLPLDGEVLDPTFGRGGWWKKWRPLRLVTNDLDPGTDAMYHNDFRHLPFHDGRFDAVAYDPPYVSVGGRITSGIQDFLDRYGMDDAPTTPAGVQQMIDDGLAEMQRVVRPGGWILTKCQDYVSSGNLWLGTHFTTRQGLRLGLDLFDRLEHVGGARAQPPGRPQVHARRNLSTLLVFKKPQTRQDTVERNQAKKRAFVQAYKMERGCADCGYNAHPEALDFDHRPGETKMLNIGQKLCNVGLARIKEEIVKCDVVCSNCHRVRTWKRRQEGKLS